ncbi:MAG: CBS domain-containing protein [Gammaproteobacteria bacterium]|nr:CBS domain-containing protein [Gammaproteobacteria bacterium]MDH5778059.1 CBS domain-containing protein [Gammaproteobacteria bacterium]
MSEDRSNNNGEDSESQTWLSWLRRLIHKQPQDKEQLVDVLRDAQQKELLDVDGLSMIEGVLQVADMQVRDIMIPRSQMVVVELDVEPEKILPVVIASAHSRFPVVGESRDEVMGILLAKDLLPLFIQQAEKGDATRLNLRDLLRPAVFIPESKRLNVLLKEFRASRNHMAIVVDEYGGVAGLVTIEDVLEQIVGEIEDEHDFDDDLYILDHDDDRWTIKAITPIEDFNEYFKVDLDDEEFDTIGGLVMNAFSHLPKRGETVDIESFRFKVLRADNRRIHLLQLTRIEPGQDEDALDANEQVSKTGTGDA